MTLPRASPGPRRRPTRAKRFSIASRSSSVTSVLRPPRSSPLLLSPSVPVAPNRTRSPRPARGRRCRTSLVPAARSSRAGQASRRWSARRRRSAPGRNRADRAHARRRTSRSPRGRRLGDGHWRDRRTGARWRPRPRRQLAGDQLGRVEAAPPSAQRRRRHRDHRPRPGSPPSAPAIARPAIAAEPGHRERERCDQAARRRRTGPPR